MDLLFLGTYPRFLARVTALMQVEPGDEILDLGSGTGRNARLMLAKTGSAGRIVGVDISERMLRRARRQCAGYPQIRFVNRRIEQPLPFVEEFDKVFLSFTLHGLEDADKRRTIANARQALRPGGSLCILDYNQFDLERMLWPLRRLFTYLECELAREFLELDLRRMVAEGGFGDLTSYQLLRGYVRLLAARKQVG